MRSKLIAPVAFAKILDSSIQKARVADLSSGLPWSTRSWWDAEDKQLTPAVNSSVRNYGSPVFDGGQQHVIKSRAEFRNPWGGNPLKM